ncbi:B12-binding domain-containing radical SAM protein [Moorena bouillonii]|uniref:Radical SAM protein n=1 Tax=Moorena bouillonii PNG TaxID=568701 RepID=A0A1U7N5W8_9CYAN|nr:radical SAM protein [Moorena bouillonii]OLT61350.1 radical SAM protein [Moorena bouillonii PNG]
MSDKTSGCIGLVELPQLKLSDPDGNDFYSLRKWEPIVSKQILLSSLEAGGFETKFINLRDGDYQENYGRIAWKGIELTKNYVGVEIESVDPESCEVWCITVNFTLYREIAMMVLKHLASKGKPVVVGGSDPFADPQIYLRNGASVVVKDKSGAANWALFNYLLGKGPKEALTGVVLADGTQYPNSKKPLHPEDWPLPSLDVARQCLGTQYWMDPFPEHLKPIGSIFPDIGCDRHCDFCQTPTYGTGYRRMTPKRVLEWLDIQRQAGAKSVVSVSDQFLGRVIFPDGRQEVLDIMKGLREMDLTILWPNGLELRKMTLGRGRNYDSTDLTPDEELINALYNWDGQKGTLAGGLPAERPVFGREAYAKLLPWQQHKRIVKTIVRAGIPMIVYHMIIGLPDDDDESMLRLEEALWEIYDEVKAINPSMVFQISPFVISPILGTPQGEIIRKSGLLRFDDPALFAGFWTASVDTKHLSYEQVSDWQFRLASVGDSKNLQVPQRFRTLPDEAKNTEKTAVSV